MATQEYIDDNIYYLYAVFLTYNEPLFHAEMKYTYIKEYMGRLSNTTYIPADQNTPIIVGRNKNG